MDYVPRIVDAELAERLASAGAVVIEGPKGCGKTATGRRLAKSEVLLDVDQGARRMVDLAPEVVLSGDVPRLIDEWQVEPALWNHIRRAVDDRGAPGQFILTGSAVPADDITRHSGAGRLSRLRMRPLSLFESGFSGGEVSLEALLGGEPALARDPGVGLPALVDQLVSGGWPGSHGLSIAARLRYNRDYVVEVCRNDLHNLDGVARDPILVERLLRSLARNVTTEAKLSTLAKDTAGADGPLGVDTVRDYMDALTRVHVLEPQPAWAPHIRSRSRLRKSPRRHFVDPSLGAAALAVGPDRILADLEFLGLMFESMVVRDLRIYAQRLDATVFHYRDNTGLASDAIVELPDGRWGACEIKLGQRQVEVAVDSLKRLAQRVDTDRCGTPAFLAVITSSGYAYRRPDGVDVLPITVLGP